MCQGPRPNHVLHVLPWAERCRATQSSYHMAELSGQGVKCPTTKGPNCPNQGSELSEKRLYCLSLEPRGRVVWGQNCLESSSIRCYTSNNYKLIKMRLMLKLTLEAAILFNCTESKLPSDTLCSGSPPAARTNTFRHTLLWISSRPILLIIT